MSGKVKKSSCFPAGAAQAPGSLGKGGAAKRGELLPAGLTPAPAPGAVRAALVPDKPPAGAKTALLRPGKGGHGEGGRSSSDLGGEVPPGEKGGEPDDAVGLKSLANTVPRSSTATFMVPPPGPERLSWGFFCPPCR